MLLAGGTANLPYLREFLEEKLSLPVEAFNPLQRISVGKGVDVDALGREAHQLGEIVGLGLRASDKAVVGIDLVPDVVQAQRDITRRKPALMVAAALFLIGLLAWVGFKAKSVSDAKAFLAGLESEEVDLDQPANKIRRLLKAEDSSVKLIKAYAAAEEGRVSFVNLWNDISQYFVSENVWITDLELRTNFSLEKNGSTEGVLDASFASGNYGSSALSAEKEMADSISIKGFHLDKNLEVLDILKRLKSSEILTFEWEEKAIPDNQLIKLNMAAPNQDTGDYAASFEFVIPLAKPIKLN